MILTREQIDAMRLATTEGGVDAVHSAGVLAWANIWETLEAAQRDRDTALERVKTLEAALYPLVTEGLDADAREDAPEFDGDEIYTGLRALPQCAKCVGTGSTDQTHYVDVPIPEAVVCPDCFGRGFTMHPFTDAAGALDG